MIVIHVNFGDASPEERAAIEPKLDALRSEDVVITTSDSQDGIDEVKEILLDHLAEKRMTENALFDQRDVMWLKTRNVLNPAQELLVNDAFQRLCDEGILSFDANANGMRLTKAGFKFLYSR